jgi:hypothetical protein
MAPLDDNLNTREFLKFALTSGGMHAVRVLLGDTVSFSYSGLNIAGKVTEVVLNDTTWTALPATALTSRNAIRIQNYSGVEVKTNYDTGISGYVGMVIDANGGHAAYDISPNIVIYGKTASGSATVFVEELS